MAHSGVRSIFYWPIMSSLGLRQISPDRKKIGEILGDVSRMSLKEHGVLLSALVHCKPHGATRPTRPTRPSKSFFSFAKEQGLDWDDDDEFVRRQTDAILAKFA